jgi:beta-lactamase regulating signal transducer with metallopeptidase domain
MLAWLASLFVRRAAIVHALWAVALLRLVMPPLLPVPLLPSGPLPADAPPPAVVVGHPIDHTVASDGGEAGAPVSFAPTRGRARLMEALGLTVVIGALVVAALAAIRGRRFYRLLRNGRPPSVDLATRIAVLSGRLGLRRAPRAVQVDACLSPLLWPTGQGPLLVLPGRLLERLTDEELDALLVHELAHLRRRDHWLRVAEVLATIAFWWYPVAWWLRRSLRDAEERCCDEWVLRMLPGSAKAHALGLLKVVEFTSVSTPPLPDAASAAVRGPDLESRLTALFEARPRAPLGARARVGLTLAAALALAVFPASCRQDSLGELSADLAILAGAPGDPLVKYVGLPVKVLPEETFRGYVEDCRQRTAARAQAIAPVMPGLRAEMENALAAARQDVERTRDAWLASPEGSPQKVAAENAYVAAMRKKDEATRQAGDLTLAAMDVDAVANARWRIEIDFQQLPGAIASTRTDSDGRISVRLPRTGSFVIAMPIPTQGGWSPLGTRSYYWRASLDGRPAKHLTLRGETGVEGEPPFLVGHRPRR